MRRRLQPQYQQYQQLQEQQPSANLRGQPVLQQLHQQQNPQQMQALHAGLLLQLCAAFLPAPQISVQHSHHSSSRQRCYMTRSKGFGAKPKPAFKYSGKVRPGTQSPKREVPKDIMRPEYAETGKQTSNQTVQWIDRTPS